MKRPAKKANKRTALHCKCGERLKLPLMKSVANNGMMETFDHFVEHVSHGGCVFSDGAITVDITTPKRKIAARKVAGARKELSTIMESAKAWVKNSKARPVKAQPIKPKKWTAEELVRVVSSTADLPTEVVTEAAKLWLSRDYLKTSKAPP